jgi:hypothetical protein
MNKFTTTLAAGMLLGGLGAIPASAATPAMPTAGVTTTEVGYRHGYRRHSGMRHRMMRRPRSMRSDSNARNPSQPGYQQQKGQTSGGPRY